MTEVFSLLAVAVPIAITLMLLVLASLSYRLGAVTRRAPLYRLFYVAAVFGAMGIVSGLWSLSLHSDDFARLGGDEPTVLIYALPLAIAIWLGLFVAWRYWSWLIYARDIATPSPKKK